MSYNHGYCPDDTDARVKQKWADEEYRSRLYSYDDAIDLAGNGWYNVSLLAVLSMAILSMATEIFGISVILIGANCEFDLTLKETSILLSVSFIGPIVMAYPWGYLSDTKGRRKVILTSLWVAFVFSAASAFAPDWTTLAALKLLSTCFISGTQSATYTLLGESCPRRLRDAYVLVMTSILDFSLPLYVGIAYLVLRLNFSFDMGMISFTPWRLLTLVLALPIALGAIGLQFFYESPRFLQAVGREDEALEVLSGIWRWNGGEMDYPVQKIFLDEDANHHPGTGLLRLLWGQIVPLFKPPLLWRSLQLYTITLIVFGTYAGKNQYTWLRNGVLNATWRLRSIYIFPKNNSYFMWFPFLAEHFVAGLSSGNQDNPGLCSVIIDAYTNTTQMKTTQAKCVTKVDISLFYSSLVQGLTFVIVLLCITRFANKKRLLVITILSISSVCAALAAVVKENITSFIMYFGLLLNELLIGVIFSYFVDLYPTSIRGTAACLGTMVARSSALGGVSLLGAFFISHCNTTFYVCSAILFCGVAIGASLPSDNPSKR